MSALPPRQFVVFRVTPEEADDCASLFRSRLGERGPVASTIAGWVQTGRAVFATRDERSLGGVARQWSDDGIDYFDHLTSIRPWAGLALVRFFGRYAQDRGIRLVRTTAPDQPRFADYFAYSGYRPVGRESADDGSDSLILERRVPLLTVREMRRTDAEDLSRLTDGHPWDFQRRIRPGWFVLADGDSFAGFISLKETAPGVGLVAAPVLLEGYEGRRLELWMIERVVHYAETHGVRSLELSAGAETGAIGRELEDAGWTLAGGRWVRSLGRASAHRIGGEFDD